MTTRAALVLGAAGLLFLVACGSEDGGAGSESVTEASRDTASESVTVTEASRDTKAEATTTTTTTTPPTTSTTSTTTTTTVPPLTRDACTETPEEGIFQKDSSESVGRCLHFWASVFQFDANTGPCQFLGKYGSSPHSRNYEFSDAIINVEGLQGSPLGGIPGTGCDLLLPVVENDLVEVWAVNLGTESYSTTIGGSNTYTKFGLVDIVQYGSS